MNVKNGKIVIVGAGIAGLALAYRLLRSGREVLLIERESKVGGLAKSFEYDGFVFDIGPHRFHTDDPEVMDFILEILGDDYLTIARKSGVWMFDRYFEWPLALSSLFQMPPSVLFKVGRDMLTKSKGSGVNFEDYIIRKYGETLYRIFFKPYTEKFLGLPCDEISAEWAATGIDRAVIDKKIRLDDLAGLAKSLLTAQPPLQFVYPRSGGIGVFAQKLAERIIEMGGRILAGSGVDRIASFGGKITEIYAEGVEHGCDLMVWTGPVPELLEHLGKGTTCLEYLQLITYNYCLDGEHLPDYQWCYFGGDDIPFNRVSVPALFNPELAPVGRSGVCVEVTSRKGNPLWDRPEDLEPAIRKSLSQVGFLKSDRDVLGVHIEKVGNAYPIYKLDYGSQISKINEIAGEFANLKLLGRTGSFWYNNMDHSIRAAIDLSRDAVFHGSMPQKPERGGK